VKSSRKVIRVCALLGVLGLACGARGTVGLRVIIENRAPTNGTWLTPVWVGFHDGDFDTYGLNLPASVALERLAEDGNSDPLSAVFAASGHGTIEGVIPADVGLPQIGPGETATMTFVVDNYDYHNNYFSFLTMVIPSNDAFIGNESPQAHRLFDAYGSFLGAYFTIYGSDVLDAGTEVNDEVPEHTAFFGQTVPDSGVPEYSVVHPHPGYLPPGSGGILDDPNFANADFTVPGYQVARITIIRSDTVVPSGAVSGVWDYDGSPYLIQGDIAVPNGQTLTIEPGVLVVSLCDCRLVVEGSLQAIGTEDAPITFTKDESIPEWHGLHFFYGSQPSQLSYCLVEYGDADGAEPDDLGGGLYCQQSTVSLDHCTIRYNDAYEGGGIYCDTCDLDMSYSHIENNSAISGGAGIKCDDSSVVLYQNDITNNTLSSYDGFGGSGGGVYLSYSDAIVLNNNISDNQLDFENTYYSYTTYARGGGLAILGTSAVTVQDNRMVGNLVHVIGYYGSTAYGGAISWENAGIYPFTVSLLNNTIANNTAEALGAYNEAHGGGLYANGDVAIANTILWNNVPQEISAPSTYGSLDISVSYSDVQGGAQAVEIAPNNTLYWLDGNIDTDPLFIDAATGDYRLQGDSPCIDAGDPAFVPEPGETDLDGHSRVWDGDNNGSVVVDMGAYEFGAQLYGDLNCDGTIGFGDINAFVLALSDPAAYVQHYPDCDIRGADINADGSVDFGDINPFVSLLSG
jgi:hypothetical protein